MRLGHALGVTVVFPVSAPVRFERHEPGDGAGRWEDPPLRNAPPQDRRLSEMLLWLSGCWGAYNEFGREGLSKRFKAAFPEWRAVQGLAGLAGEVVED